MTAWIDNVLRPRFTEASLFADLAVIDGDVYRELEARRTVRFEWAGQRYFAKVHFGVGWLEICKNLVQGRLPVVSAANEWRAIARLRELGIDTLSPVAFATDGLNPATRHSCIVTRALEETISLEDLVATRRLDPGFVRRLVVRLADISGRMHRGGVNHRDYYICHFLMPQSVIEQAPGCDNVPLYLIDLHRAQVRARTPERWRVKDIGGLLFSAITLAPGRNNLFRFMRTYSGKSLRRTLAEDSTFWRRVIDRAISLYCQDHDAAPGWLQDLSLGAGSLPAARRPVG